MTTTDLRPSVRATYDSRETGMRYQVTSTVNDHPVCFREPINDPFVRHTVHVGWGHILWSLLRWRRVVVEVTVSADRELMDDVLELDENALIPGRTRAAAFQAHMHEALRQFGEEVS